MIIDSHIVVWSAATDLGSSSMRWPGPGQAAWQRDVTLAEVDPEMTRIGVTGVVLVQASNTLRHTEELLATAAAASRPTKVVGWLPLTDPAATDRALRRYVGRSALAGVRHRVLDEDDPAILLSCQFARSLDLVADAGLSLDILPWPPGVLGQVPAVARRHPNLPIALNVLGWPEVGERRMQPWTDELAAAAAQPTVSLKVGGLYRLAGGATGPRDWQPYVATAMELFGAERIMIAGDWPAVAVFGHGYAESVQSVLAAFHDLTPSERAQVQVGTAARVYGFDPSRSDRAGS